MRTKTLLLTAAVIAAGVAASQAQVYSVNAVGYVNVAVGSGYNLIANPLNGTNNQVNTVIPTAPDSSLLYKWNKVTQSFPPALTFFDFGPGAPETGWYEGENKSTLSVDPGDAIYFVNPGAATTLTFVGEVPQGTNLTVQVAANYGFYSSIVPRQAGLSTLNFPAADSMLLYFFNQAQQRYNQALTYFDFGPGAPENGWYDGENKVDPTPAVAQGFLISNPSTARPWTQNFSVN